MNRSSTGKAAALFGSENEARGKENRELALFHGDEGENMLTRVGVRDDCGNLLLVPALIAVRERIWISHQQGISNISA